MTLLVRSSGELPREQTLSKSTYPYRREFGATRPRAIYENFSTSPDETIAGIHALRTWPQEWDGYQLAPSGGSIRRALSWIDDLYDDVSTMGRKWMTPLVVADAHGNVVFEWLNDRNRLVVYVSPTTVEYVKAWGPDIWSDMEDGEIGTPQERKVLWRWLMG